MRRPREVKIDGGPEGIFVIVDGVKIATRGTGKQAKTWVSLERGWSVTDNFYSSEEQGHVTINHNGVAIQ